jgi:hypothetical protein
MRPFSYLLLVVPMLNLPISCGQLSTFCDAAPCPNFAPSAEIQPQPSLEMTAYEVHPGEVRTLRVHVDLRGLPAGTPLHWVRPTNVTGPDTVLLDVPGYFRVESWCERKGNLLISGKNVPEVLTWRKTA